MNKNIEDTLKMALEALENLINYDYNGNPDNEIDVAGVEAITAIKETLAVDKESLTTEAQQSNEQGCEHCNHSLYCGTKCKNCGKQSNEQVEPVVRSDLPPQPKEPEQEHVAQLNKDPDTGKLYVQWTLPWALLADGTKFYTTPPQPQSEARGLSQSKPLIASQREKVFAEADKLMDADDNLSWRIAILKATEAAHGIKG
jgi:hypothetical protein